MLNHTVGTEPKVLSRANTDSLEWYMKSSISCFPLLAWAGFQAISFPHLGDQEGYFLWHYVATATWPLTWPACKIIVKYDSKKVKWTAWIVTGKQQTHSAPGFRLKESGRDWKLPNQHSSLQAQPAAERKRKGTHNSIHVGWGQLTVEEGIEVLIAVKIESGVFTTGAVCFRGKAHLEAEWTTSGRKRSRLSELTSRRWDWRSRQ